MFNVMVTGAENAWEEGVYIWDKSRILEYTSEEIVKPREDLSISTIEELAKLPTLFLYERNAGTAKIGLIEHVQQRGFEVRIIFEFDDSVPALTAEQVEKMEWDLGLAKFELYRTHWAVKNGDLYAILRDAGYLPENVAQPVLKTEERALAVDAEPARVFLVHGRDEGVKHAVARFLEHRVGVEVVILSERPNQGRSILTKFESEAEGAVFAVVLLTPDDVGGLRTERQRSRAPDPVHRP